MDCTLHNVYFRSRDHSPITPQQALSISKETEFTMLLRGYTCRCPLNMDSVIRFSQQGPLSGNSYLVDQEICKYRLGHWLRTTFHQSSLRRRDYFPIAAYGQHRPQTKDCCIQGCVLSHCERFTDGKHCFFLVREILRHFNICDVHEHGFFPVVILIVVYALVPQCRLRKRNGTLTSLLTTVQTLTVPFFAQRTLQCNALWTAWVAEISLNLFGLITLILHLFLRSNADRLAIQPLEGTRQDKKRLKLFNPSDLEMTMHITSPVLRKKEDDQYTDDKYKSMTAIRTESPLAVSETERNDSRNGDLMNEIVAEYSRPVQSPSQAFVSPSIRRKGSNYSLFPTFRSAMLRNSMSTTFSQDDDSQTSQLPRPPVALNHKRDLSEQTSATVQIGFRLSNMSEPQRPTTLSPTASSCCLPLQGKTDSSIESPAVSSMSSGPAMARTTSRDSMGITLQPHTDPRAEDTIPPVQIKDRDGRQDQSSMNTPKMDRPMTMKALPPIPSIADRLSSADHPMPDRF